MKTTVLSESGYEESMLGISLSWASSVERAKQIAPNLAHKQGGHNKFLESIILWLDVVAPRYWWQEADTYRVGSTKQSASTMHTIMKDSLDSVEDFELPISDAVLDELNSLINLYKNTEIPSMKTYSFRLLKNTLPEGFLQRRIWVINYKTLQNMYHQRINHKLPQWPEFLNTTISQIEHPEFIVK